jgi:hypothetical protein
MLITSFSAFEPNRSIPERVWGAPEFRKCCRFSLSLARPLRCAGLRRCTLGRMMKIWVAALYLGTLLASDVALARPQRSCSENFAYCLRNCMAVSPARFAQSACSVRCHQREHNCMTTVLSRWPLRVHTELIALGILRMRPNRRAQEPERAAAEAAAKEKRAEAQQGGC